MGSGIALVGTGRDLCLWYRTGVGEKTWEWDGNRTIKAFMCKTVERSREVLCTHLTLSIVFKHESDVLHVLTNKPFVVVIQRQADSRVSRELRINHAAK